LENQNHPILLELQQKSQPLFGFKLISWEPISLGWLNLKWKLVTDKGEFVLKIFHAKRYRQLDELNRGLHQQQRLHNEGVPCPELVAIEGEVLHISGDEKFIIMKFSSGSIVKPKDISLEQMYELGKVTGKMHRILNDSSLGMESGPQSIPPSREERLLHWNTVIEEAKLMNKPISHIEQQLKLTETIDVDSFEISLTGWAHRDLWVDNLLFLDNKVSAVLDFDRLNFDYPEIDVARAIMSWAFHNDDLRVDYAAAFLSGYRMENEYSSGKLVDSMRLLWYLESVWWIRANMDDHNRVETRFAEEMIWLALNNERLPMVVGNL
jgi:homoserine kinase type II